MDKGLVVPGWATGSWRMEVVMFSRGFGFFSFEGVRPLLDPFLNWGWSETDENDSAWTSYLGGVSSKGTLGHWFFFFGPVCSR